MCSVAENHDDQVSAYGRLKCSLCVAENMTKCPLIGGYNVVCM